MALVFAVLILSAVLGGIYGPAVRATPTSADELKDAVSQFTNVLAVVQQNYAVPVDTDHAIYEGAIPGMLRVLDPHSTFFDPQAYALLREDQRGEYYGVGMTIAPDRANPNETEVLAPMVGTPAFRAGLRPGDIIIKVDGKPTDGLTTTEVADLLKGPKGTTVTISVRRDGADAPIDFTVMRDEIPKHSVDVAFMLKPGIGYIKLSGFNETTDAEMTEALKDLDAPSLDGLILDLRGNPGGLLQEAIAVSDKFLDKNQLIVSDHGRASPEKRYYAVSGNRGVTCPLVVLINGGSASAAEIVTGSIQDHDRGLVVGDQSFGKGLVQSVSQLSEDTGLALTIARYYTPSGRLIQRDYKDISLYDYLYNHKTPAPTEVKLTDGGRQVTGGGGITPDVVIAAPKPNDFEQDLFRHDVFYPNYPYANPLSVGGFTTWYLGTKPDVTRSFDADDAVIAEFRKYLDKAGVKYTDADITANLDWIRHMIKLEVITSVYGLNDGYKVELEDDPQLDKAVESLPQARALYDNVRKIIAQRSTDDPGQ
ncbi:MAG: S41 family peptidase [Candidatus Acidiferrales bacterium]